MTTNTHRLRRPAARASMRTALLLLLAGLILSSALLASCSRLEPLPPLKRRTVVLDFKTLPDISEEPFQIRGWWFGARTIFQNPRAGVLFADILSRRVVNLGYVEQLSRTDLRYYLGEKRRLLRSEFRNLDEARFEAILADISPLDYGGDLRVDEVIAGEVIEAYTSHHRTIHTWYSVVRVRVDLWDIAAGRVVWSREISSKRRFASQSAVMESIAEQIVREIDRDYYKKQNRPL